jgi:hypothetical protein
MINENWHLKKHEMDGSAGGVDGGANCSSVLSVSPEGLATAADLMVMQQVQWCMQQIPTLEALVR